MPYTIDIVEIKTVQINDSASVQNAYFRVSDGTDAYLWNRGGLSTSLSAGDIQTLLDGEAAALHAAAAADSAPATFALRMSGEQILAADGAVTIDEDGITIQGGSSESNTVKWVDSSGNKVQEIRSNVVGALTSGTITVYRQTEGDQSHILLLAGSAAEASGDAAGLRLFSNGTTGEASLRVYPSGTSSAASLIVGANSTPAETLDVRGNITATGFVEMDEQSAPSTPSSGNLRVYPQSDGMLYFKNDVGVEHHVATGKPYTQKSLANTTETSIFEQTIAANALGTNGSIHAPIPYRIANGTGFNQTIRWRLYYDDTVLIDYTTPNIASDANPYEGLAWFQMYNTGISSGSNAQRAQLRLDLAAAAAVGSAATTGGTYNVTIGGTASEDSTAAKVLKLTVTLSANGGTAPSFRSGGAAPLGPYAL
jgi:hypothetical protein